MQEQLLYEYAVIRVVPRVEREEFVNAGIILFCKKTGHIGCRIFLNEQKLRCFDEKTDIETVQKNLRAFELIAAGDKLSGSPIAKLDAPSRFRWLTATRSTIIQCSKVHPGLTGSLEKSLDKLMQEIVF
ncbi:MAG TPA: DUF3037 domain-containing protein [Niabella sp.]|nr:DUF3037 domain-containing protein [Niabella sp.]